MRLFLFDSLGKLTPGGIPYTLYGWRYDRTPFGETRLIPDPNSTVAGRLVTIPLDKIGGITERIGYSHPIVVAAINSSKIYSYKKFSSSLRDSKSTGSENQSTLLQEVHIKDMYPKQMLAFLKKYRSIARKEYVDDLYVQFTDYQSSTMHKRFAEKPNHADPAGFYAYPMAYVLKYPADVWYGAGAKYIRVLEAKPDHPIFWIAEEIKDQYDAKSTLRRMGLPAEYYGKAVKYRRAHGLPMNRKTKSAQAFMTAFQLDFSKEPLEDGTGNVRYPVRPSLDQNKLLRKAGIESIRDSGRTEGQAIINSREPDQVLFLTPAAFNVREVVQIRWGDKDHGVTSQEFLPSERKLASTIAQGLGQRLEGKGINWDWMQNFFTDKGWKISVSFLYSDDYMDTHSMGVKKHREAKQSNYKSIKALVNSPYGGYGGTFPASTKFEEIAQDMAADIRTAKSWGTENKDWEPESTKSLQAMKKQLYKDREKQNQKKVSAEYLKYAKFLGNMGDSISAMTGIPWDWPTDTDEAKAALWLSNFVIARMKDAPPEGPVTAEYLQSIWQSVLTVVADDDTFPVKNAVANSSTGDMLINFLSELLPEYYPEEWRTAGGLYGLQMWHIFRDIKDNLESAAEHEQEETQPDIE